MQTPNLGRFDKMALGAAVWLCTLPFAFVAFFFFGWQVGLATAIGLLLVVTVFCWAWCGFHLWQKHPSQ